MKLEHAQELTSIADAGGDVWWRTLALSVDMEVYKALGMKRDDWLKLRCDRTIRGNNGERLNAVLELKAEGRSNREIAGILGVDPKTIRNDLGEENSPPPSNEPAENGHNEEPTAENSPPPHNHRAQGTGENEWYTPVEYVDLARKVLGKIDLDPASSAAAQKTVQATHFFTEKDNGLIQDWKGRVWLNPPYAQPLIAHFITKMVGEWNVGRVKAAIMLTHNYTDTAWFHEAAKAASAICFTRGRVKFVDAAGNDCSPTQGQAFFYFGGKIATFASAFGEIGFVLVRRD